MRSHGFRRNERGRIVTAVIALLVASVVGFQVVVPVLSQAAADISGAAGAITALFPLFIALTLFVAAAGTLVR